MKFKLRTCCAVVVLCIIFLIPTFGSVVLGGSGENYKAEDDGNSNPPEKKPSLWQTAKNAFSLYTSSPLRIPTYTEKVKTMIHQVEAYLFPPNLEGSRNNVESTTASHSGAGGAGEKVKEAMGKSFDKSEETVDESAKSAANLFGETVQKTKDKVKRSFTGKENRESTEPQAEL